MMVIKGCFYINCQKPMECKANLLIVRRAKLKLHLLGDFEASDTLATHRIVWIPHIQNGGGDDGSSGAGADGEQMDFGVGGIMTLFYRDVVRKRCCFIFLKNLLLL